MNTQHKNLLVRADFVLDRSRGGARLLFKRWRRVLADALPGLMGIKKRCARAVVRLHYGEEEGRFTAWLRVRIDRLPSRKRLQKIKTRLRDKLETVLLAIGGEVVKFNVRRQQPKPVLHLVPGDIVPIRLAPWEAELVSR